MNLPDEPFMDTCIICGKKFYAYENPKSELETWHCKDCYEEAI